jgi:hypothetical protein
MNIAELEVVPPRNSNNEERNEDEGSGFASAAAADPPAGTHPVQWYYYLQNDPQRRLADGWYEYDAQSNLTVEEHFQSGQRLASAKRYVLSLVTSSGYQYEIDFSGMVQRNAGSGKERPIFRTDNGHPPPGPPPTAPATIFDFITDHDWDALRAIVASNPKEAEKIDPASGRSPLHMVCSFGSSPPHLVSVVAAAAPSQLKVNDKVYNDTPMHIVCRNSQRTRSKVEYLLELCAPEDVLRRNMIGGTCLHSACGHNAMFPVIEQIVRKNPAVLKVSTFDGISPLRGLFFSYTQSIPGVLAVGKMLKGREVTEGHFQRFWQKADLLALEFYKLTNACPLDRESITNDYVAHGLIHYNAPLNLLKIALKRDPTCATALDRDGNTPLHLLVERRPYRLKEKEALQATLAANPESAGVANHAGHPPLMLAIRNKIPFENGVGEILKADMRVVSTKDTETALYPFQLAAAVGGPEALNTTFQLLSALPQQIGF